MSSSKALLPDVTKGKESPAVISEGTYVEHITALFLLPFTVPGPSLSMASRLMSQPLARPLHSAGPSQPE